MADPQTDPLTEMCVEVRVTMPAPPERVFALLSDVEQMAGLGPEHVEARWDGNGPALGATFSGRNVRGQREWSVPCRVDVFDPPAAFGWVVGDPEAPTAWWRYSCRSDAAGTAVVQTFRHGPGWSFLRRAVERAPDQAPSIIEGRAEELSANMHTVLREAAARLEQESADD